MATTNTPEPRPLTIEDLETVGRVMGDAVAHGIEKTQRRKVTVGEYMQREGSVFNTKRPRLKRESYQNGYRLTQINSSDEEIRLLNQITHSGRYLNRLVTVALSDDGNGGEQLDIRWPCKTRDQQMNLKNEARNFVEILTQIVTVQKEEDEIENERKHPPRAHFGGKATQEARERASA